MGAIAAVMVLIVNQPAKESLDLVGGVHADWSGSNSNVYDNVGIAAWATEKGNFIY